MGFSKKPTSSNHPMDESVEAETKKGWIITLRSPLKPILTSKKCNKHVDAEEEQEFATTPTYEESRLSRKYLTCPPAPKKRKTSSSFLGKHLSSCVAFSSMFFATIQKKGEEKQETVLLYMYSSKYNFSLNLEMKA
ncbi:hypothetical protein K7X08_030840 [Anisodus acutangulus]|uniref:Uncharacterized protein n=1 Tax=Anisodus acutangulus TaxID=402998 RepID=A0A9Q1M078_9SOLA|nr:hypothetical protein K7X08_030840 [Anisodus acutangulus]